MRQHYHFFLFIQSNSFALRYFFQKLNAEFSVLYSLLLFLCKLNMFCLYCALSSQLFRGKSKLCCHVYNIYSPGGHSMKLSIKSGLNHQVSLILLRVPFHQRGLREFSLSNHSNLYKQTSLLPTRLKFKLNL